MFEKGAVEDTESALECRVVLGCAGMFTASVLRGTLSKLSAILGGNPDSQGATTLTGAVFLCSAAVDRALFSVVSVVGLGADGLRPRCDAFPVSAEREGLRLNVLVGIGASVDSVVVVVGPALVLGLLAVVGVLLPPKMFPPLKRPLPDVEPVDRCILGRLNLDAGVR